MKLKMRLRKKISTQKLYEVIRNPLVSEKSTYVSQFNYYVFKVSNKSTKPQIKQAVEKLFDVKVLSVNTLNQNGKIKLMFGDSEVNEFSQNEVKLLR